MAYQKFRQTGPDTALAVTLDAYTAGDVVGGLLTFTLNSTTLSGYIHKVKLTDAANQSEAYVMWFFNAVPTTFANDAAFAPVIADLKACIGRVTIAAADYTTVNSLGIVEATPSEDIIGFDAATTGHIYAYLVATVTPDYAATTDLAVEVTLATWELGG